MPEDHIAFYETCCGDENETIAPDTVKHYAERFRAARATAVPRFTSQQELDQSLRPHLPPLGQALTRKRPLEDSVFSLITECLTYHGKGEWSLRPRTYAVLRMLGCPDLLEDFVKAGLYDSALPYTEANLPDMVRGLTLRSRFLQLQRLVLCQERDIAALEDGGKHLHPVHPVEEYLHHVRDLGVGERRPTIVDLVISLRTARPFARKRLRRGASVPTDAKILGEFEREIQSLKRLRHKHIVKLVGSYTDSDYVGIIMDPVADMDLADFLGHAKIDPALRKRQLRPFFGCLATALAYLHRKDVRHNDIKPKNILVKDSKVYLTDFGLARTWDKTGRSTTIGNHEGGTPPYLAPELIHGQQPRNTASDIWSLGCVFLQMATALADYSPNDFDGFYTTHGTQRVDRLALNNEATELWMREIRSKLSRQDAKILDITRWMLKTEMDDRPSPMQLRAAIIDANDEGNQTFICADCSSPGSLEDEKNGDVSQPQPVSATDLGRLERELSTVQPIITEEKNPSPPRPEPQPPDPGIDKPEDPVPEPDINDKEEYAFINPSVVTVPPFFKKDSMPFPTATLVPSYVLAGTNHLSHSAVEDAQRYNPLSVNLFVYGRLMFPSILHSIAAASLDGAYAPKLGRRLYPTTADWARADVSIKSASDNMTPARLLGYDRWRPRGLNCAVAQEARLTERILKQCRRSGPSGGGADIGQPPGNVTGFLALGLRSDAIRYCDLLFQSDTDTLWRLTPPTDDDDNEWKHRDFNSSPLLHRRKVEVEVELDDGAIKTIEAETYVWAHGTEDLVNLWNEDRFVRSSVMNKLLSSRPNWTTEEQQLASSVNMELALVGDYLCSAIMSGDIHALAGLLDDRHFSPDSPCRRYGLPLHAAVVAGRDDMVRLLISQKANLNASSSLYGTPLIAAAIHGRIEITKTLLHHGANVLTSDRVHINALYQAVSHANWGLTNMLLEHGAWLSNNWGEILDLADSLGPEGADIQKLLSVYDVRGRTRRARRHRAAALRSALREDRRRGRRLDESEETAIVRQAETSWDMVRYSEVGTAVIRRLATVMQIPYNWKGRKAVELTVAALEAGAPLNLIQLIREAIHPVKAILDMLRESDKLQQMLDPLSLGSSRLIQGVEGGYGKDSDLDSDSETSSGRRHSRDRDFTSPRTRERDHGSRHIPSLSTRANELSLSPSRPPPHFRISRSSTPGGNEDDDGRRRRISRATSVSSAPRQDRNHLCVPGLDGSGGQGSLRRSVSAREGRSSRSRREDR